MALRAAAGSRAGARNRRLRGAAGTGALSVGADSPTKQFLWRSVTLVTLPRLICRHRFLLSASNLGLAARLSGIGFARCLSFATAMRGASGWDSPRKFSGQDRAPIRLPVLPLAIPPK